MLCERFVTAIRAEPRSANTSIAKDVGIYLHELQPNASIKASFKKSSAPVNALAATATHIFAAQADKAVVHVYSREKGNQEALVSFPERIQSLTNIGDGVLVLGTAEGRVILWEVRTGRQVSTPAAHLQAISSLAATNSDLVTGSEDSNIHVWSVPRLLSIPPKENPEPLRTLSNHRDAITNLRLGHSASYTNICVSASKDNTVIVWNYHSGELLRTFLLPTTPLCLSLDPCDRGVYVGFIDGSIQLIEFVRPESILHPLYDTSLQAAPTQVTTAPWTSPSEAGAALCISINYDGTILLSGHASGKIFQWDTGRRSFAAETADLNAPVTNLIMESPFPEPTLIRTNIIVKPKISEGNYTLTTQFTGSTTTSSFEKAVATTGIPSLMLEDAISRLTSPTATSPSGDDKLRKENEDLWKIINEQRTIQKKTWEKYTELKSGGR